MSVTLTGTCRVMPIPGGVHLKHVTFPDTQLKNLRALSRQAGKQLLAVTCEPLGVTRILPARLFARVRLMPGGVVTLPPDLRDWYGVAAQCHAQTPLTFRVQVVSVPHLMAMGEQLHPVVDKRVNIGHHGSMHADLTFPLYRHDPHRNQMQRDPNRHLRVPRHALSELNHRLASGASGQPIRLPTTHLRVADGPCTARLPWGVGLSEATDGLNVTNGYAIHLPVETAVANPPDELRGTDVVQLSVRLGTDVYTTPAIPTRDFYALPSAVPGDA